MKSVFLLILISLVTFLSAQSRWGIEFKGSRFNTNNSGQLEGASFGLSYYTILKEEDLVSNSASLAIIFRLNERNLLKLHQGFHQNGRIVTIKIGDDQFGNTMTYPDINLLWHYFQITPSYVYRVLNKKIIIPVEVGINMNFETEKYYVFYVGVENFNLSYEISTGVDYRLAPHFILGLHGFYSGNISEYQFMYEYGTFEPKEMGLEFSMMYEFGKSL